MSGTVYRVIGTDGHFFIGSTKQDLTPMLYYLKYRSVKDALSHFDTVGWVGVKIEAIRSDVPVAQFTTAETEELNKHIGSHLCLNHTAVPTTEKRAGKYQQTRRKYYLKNKATILESNAKYRARNADKFRQWAKMKVKCTNCGSVVARSSLYTHRQTSACEAHEFPHTSLS